MPIVRSAHPEYPGAESPPSGASTTGIQPDPDVDAVLDGVPIGIFSLDHEFRITRVNSLAELFMRKPRQEVLGKNIWDEFPGAVGTPFHRAGLKAMAEQVTVELEEFYPPFNLWLEVQARPSDEGLNIYVRDISERRLAEDALRERQWELQAILDSTADGILVVDNEGKISYGNQRFAYMWRIPADVLATQSDDQLLAFVLDQLSDPEQFLSKVRELYRTSREDFDSISFRDGRVFERYSRPLLRGHEPAGRVWSFRDVTRRTRVEAQLRLTHELAMAIGSAATVQEAVGIALTKVCEATGWVLGQAWFPSADGTHLECGSTWYAGAEGLGPFRAMSAATTFSPGVGLPGRVWASKERVWVTDVTADTNFPRASSAAEVGLVAAMGVPILSGDRVAAVMEFFVSHHREEDARLLDVVGAVAQQVGSLVRRKEIEDALRISEARFRAVAETAVEGIVSADARGNITYFNRGAEVLFGWSAADVSGKPLTVLMPDRFHEAHVTGLHRVLSGGSHNVIGRTVELQAKRRDGNEFPMELSLATGQTADGMFFTGILRDITERKQVEVAMERQAAELERVNEDLSGANKIMKDFLSTTSHELRTPLASILAFASTMRDRWGSLDEEQQLHFLEVIHRQTRRVARLVDHLLAVSRIEAGAVESRLAPLDPMEVIRQTLAELEPATSEIRVEGLAGLEVMADPDHLKQIMLNYVGNALKYGAPPIVVEASERDGWVEIRVRDAGSGVPETFVPRLFEKFARAGGTQDVDGTGLGLSIVRGLARAQGGEAWYEPNAPQGSCFAVRLPGVKQ